MKAFSLLEQAREQGGEGDDFQGYNQGHLAESRDKSERVVSMMKMVRCKHY
jgi:hypothetical protein